MNAIKLGQVIKRRDDASVLAVADFARDLCLMFGATVETSYKVAGVFAEGIKAEWEKQKKEAT